MSPEIDAMLNTNWEQETIVSPSAVYNSVELFAGRRLGFGYGKAGFNHVLLNEFDKFACQTLRANRPNWNVVEGDIHNIDFSPYEGKVHFLSGAFHVAFSYAGKRLGFEETRGTLFFEMARAIKEIQPLVLWLRMSEVCWNMTMGGLLATIRNVIAELGYTLVEPRVLRAIQYNVPQKENV